MFSRLPHSSGRSRSVGRAGLSRRQRRATEVDKEENKAAAPLLSRSTGARACQLQTRGRRERSATAGEREAASLVRKWTEIVPAEANNAAPLSASLSLFAACSPRSFSGQRKDQLQPAGGAKAAGREREGGGKTKQQ